MALPDLTKSCPRCMRTGFEPDDPETSCTLCTGSGIVPLTSIHAIEEAYAMANYETLQDIANITLPDINDKVDDIKEKVDEIKTIVEAL